MGLAFVDVPWYHALMEVGVLRAHCDVCDEQIKRDRGHLWANTLPEGHKLRTVSGVLTFHSNGKGEKPMDLCNDCMLVWLRGIWGVQDPTKDA